MQHRCSHDASLRSARQTLGGTGSGFGVAAGLMSGVIMNRVGHTVLGLDTSEGMGTGSSDIVTPEEF